MSRLGVPDGMGRRGTRGVTHFRALAKHEADRIFAYLKKEDMLVEPDNDIANEALLVAIELHRDALSPRIIRLAAARTCLEWTRSKPAQKFEATVRRAEDFLLELSRDALPISRD